MRLTPTAPRLAVARRSKPDTLVRNQPLQHWFRARGLFSTSAGDHYQYGIPQEEQLKQFRDEEGEKVDSRFVRARRLLAGVICLASGLVCAQTYPNKTIKIVVPWPAGGATDSAGRMMAQRLSERMLTPVIVENKGGAAGTIGAESVARSPADGYTLLVASAETHAIAPNLRAKLSYEPLKDFVAIMPFAINPFSLVSRPGLQANTTK